MSIKSFKIEFQPNIPPELSGLKELVDDLYYSWNAQSRSLFIRLDSELWEKCKHKPKLFLRHVSQQKLDDAVNDSAYMEEYARVFSSFNAYKKLDIHPEFIDCLEPKKELIAYLCLEFGFHESFPIYSGGLGILAADVCKAASDMALPFVAIGLLYRQGYFTQEIDGGGNQIAHYYQTEFDNLPITPCVTSSGEEIRIEINLPTGKIFLKVWESVAGNMKLYLLDSDIDENDEADRQITHQLYGGGSETRIQQEIVLGLGGVRALRALNLNPTVWHINEGHAAFSMLERCRESVSKGIEFEYSVELNACNVVFTTHTPVPAGHDIFEKDMMQKYFSDFVSELGIDFDTFMKIGDGDNGKLFNMTTLALRLSRFHNGVSKIHGDMASSMEAHVWPQIPANENPIGYVTNGVHTPTFLAKEWINLFDMRFGKWRGELSNEAFWNCLDKIPAHRFWSLRRELKTALLKDVHKRVIRQCNKNGRSESDVNRITSLINPPDSDVLILGFARRFATYKRANLLFHDMERFERLVSDSSKPILLLIAGKAHPEDEPGQELVRSIYELSQRPSLQGKILLVEDYDIALARRLVAGVDVWLNTPEYPMEASGTSGQKAGMNGVLNLSVLDGWWDEGYNGKNGWAINPHGKEYDADFRNQQEASDLLEILEKEVAPLYFDRDGEGYSAGWVQLAKESMKYILPNFNAQRMLSDYVKDYYVPALSKSKLIQDKNGKNATDLAIWKSNVKKAWPKVSIKCISEKPVSLLQGDKFSITVQAELNGLSADDVIVECVISEKDSDDMFEEYLTYQFVNEDATEGHAIYKLEVDTNISGMQYFRIRIYPHHKHLCHKFEMGCMTWLDS